MRGSASGIVASEIDAVIGEAQATIPQQLKPLGICAVGVDQRNGGGDFPLLVRRAQLLDKFVSKAAIGRIQEYPAIPFLL